MSVEDAYNLKKTEQLIMELKVYKYNELKNIITIYQDKQGKIYVHNSNGIKQCICPYLRQSNNMYYCAKYKESENIYQFGFPTNWDIYAHKGYLGFRNPIYKNCKELGINIEDYKNCKWYNTIITKKVKNK